jgi:hypothetical protein
MRKPKAFSCPHCGDIVKAGALACPGCGSDTRSGWSEGAQDPGGDLPTGYADQDDDFDYDEFLRTEGLAPDGLPSRDDRRRGRLGLVVLILVVSLLAWLVLR